MSCWSGVRGEGAFSVTEILTEPVSALNAWRGDELADAGGWLIRFTEEDFADFERALGNTVQGLFCCAGCPSTTGSVWTRPPLSTGQWAEHPEYLPILNKNFPTDWRSEEPPGSPGWYLEPLYSYFGGALSATVRTGRAMSAMRFPEVPRLAADEVSCFTYFDSLAKRPGVALGMELQTGDLQFVNNLRLLHGSASPV
jgi:hypothetical protein